jgi:hypothetical protein
MMHASPIVRPEKPRQRPDIRIAAGDTVVVFSWAGDRWRHAVAAAGGFAAESVEGGGEGGDDRWPASPPLVEVSLVEIAGAAAILGVGLAGRSHFSASVVPHPQLADTLLFEIASRVQEPPAWLGSTYHAGDIVRISGAAIPRLPATVQWSYTIGPAGIRQVSPPAGPHAP